MSTWSFVKSERIALKNHPQIQESWVYDCIAGEPGILGLGDLTLNTRSGGQALVLAGAGTRFACVVQTGATDETQIIQAIECWGQERTRQSDGELRALIVAEQITPRFLNVMSLLGGSVPFTAVQMQAMKVGTQMTLIFNTVTGGEALAVAGTVAEAVGNQQSPAEEFAEQSQAGSSDEAASVAIKAETPTAEPAAYLASVELGATILTDISDLTIEIAEEPVPAAIDRSFWADQFLSIAQAVDPAFELDYRPEYIGLARDGQSLDFARFTPESTGILLGLSLEPNSLTELSIAQAGFERLSSESNGYGIRLSRQDIETQREPVTRLLQLAYDESKG